MRLLEKDDIGGRVVSFLMLLFPTFVDDSDEEGVCVWIKSENGVIDANAEGDDEGKSSASRKKHVIMANVISGFNDGKIESRRISSGFNELNTEIFFMSQVHLFSMNLSES